jgi:peptidyl-prolyl cis-trans isomerase SurA
MDKIQGQLQEMMYFERVQPALRVYLTKLRENAYIDVRQGFVDSGASPNQSKLIFTTEPEKASAKKKHHKDKKKHLAAH